MSKKLLILSLIMLIGMSPFAQSATKLTDLHGAWKAAKGGGEIFIEIIGSSARITSVGTAKFPKKIEGGTMYENINCKDDGTCTAQRNSWIYAGDPEDGRWEKQGPLTLTLSSDKNTLYASGHWTLNRVVKIIQTNKDTTAAIAKETITENFGAASGKFHLVSKPNGGSFVLAELTNKSTDKIAIVLIKTDDGKIDFQYVRPGAEMVRKYDSKQIEVQVIYQDANSQKETPGPIDFLKDRIRKIITNTDGVIKEKTWDPACMCVRG